MPIYHETREAAIEAGAHMVEYWDVKPEMEPFNGWVTVLSPKTREVFNYPLNDLIDKFELDLGRVRTADPNKKRPARIEQEPKKKKPVAPPPPPPPPPAMQKPVAKAPMAPPPPPPRS